MVKSSSKLQMHLSESTFPFSRRIMNFFQRVEISTVEELTVIPLANFTCFKGFKEKCRQELIAFIEYEEIENLFHDFKGWKK